MSESRGVALVNLGCRVNRVELDHMALDLERAGAVLTPEREARVVIVNTCAVTGEAEAKTRKAVRRAASLPSTPLVIATGCVANLFADELAAPPEPAMATITSIATTMMPPTTTRRRFADLFMRTPCE